MIGKSKASFEKIQTLIGENTVLESASLKGSGTIRIDGKYIGEATIDGDLVVGEKGIVEGNVTAHHALIAGTIHGNIQCDQHVHLSATAIMNGNVLSATLIVDEGAKFNGNCQMQQIQSNKNDKPKTDKKT